MSGEIESVIGDPAACCRPPERRARSAASPADSAGAVGAARDSRWRVPQTGCGKCESSAKRGITCQCRCGVRLPSDARFILTGASRARSARLDRESDVHQVVAVGASRSVISRTCAFQITLQNPSERLVREHHPATRVAPEPAAAVPLAEHASRCHRIRPAPPRRRPFERRRDTCRRDPGFIA